jgi:hypothetical protein
MIPKLTRRSDRRIWVAKAEGCDHVGTGGDPRRAYRHWLARLPFSLLVAHNEATKQRRCGPAPMGRRRGPKVWKCRNPR